MAVVADGSNRDDQGEYRPGLQAARRAKGAEPVGRVRADQAGNPPAGRVLGLPTWDKPATPCLSSRIAYGEQVTPERLAMIDQAERFLRERGFQPLRVRYHKGDMARIEVSVEQLSEVRRARSSAAKWSTT